MTFTPNPLGVTLIGLTGHAGSGKDTAAAYLVQRHGFVQASFADPIRSMVQLFLEEAGLDHAWATERAMKERTIPSLGVSARGLMQTIGTEVGRALHADLWVRHLELRLGLATAQPVHDRIVISDVRFENEAAWVQQWGGKIIRLHRRQAGAVRSHASEAEILALPADVDLHNHGEHFAGLHGLLAGAMETWSVDERDPLGHGNADPAHSGFTYF